MLKFYVKVYMSSLFPNLITDLLYIWYDDYILVQSFAQYHPHPLGHLKVKVKDFKVKVRDDFEKNVIGMRKSKRNFRQAILSGNRSYCLFLFSSSGCLGLASSFDCASFLFVIE